MFTRRCQIVYYVIDEDGDDDDDVDDETNQDLITDNWCQDVITANDSDSEEDDEEDGETTEISRADVALLLRKCRVLIKTINRSHILTKFTNQERENLKVSRRLVYDCITRWNSTFYMLESLIQNKPVLLKLFANKRQLSISPKQQEKLALCELSSDEWTCLSHVLQVLKPFREATELLSGSKYPTIGLCLFAIRSIKDYLEIQPNDESNLSKKLKHFLLVSMNYYFSENDEQSRLLKVSLS